MRQFFKRKSTWLAAAALGLTISLSVGSAMAYFTTYAEAEGGYTVSIGSTTKTKEEFSNWTKHVQVENTGDTVNANWQRRAPPKRSTFKASDKV